MSNVRVRIAPSPTGSMHIGTARTALFNWLFAKKNKGVFVLRIEDTDTTRSQASYEKSIMQGLLWLGLEWDEGPPLPASGNFQFPISNFQTDGKYGPYKQSERTEIYQKYLKKLLESGSAFYCNHTKEELEEEKQEQTEKKEAPRHLCAQNPSRTSEGKGAKGKSLTLTKKKLNFEEFAPGEFARSAIIRFKNPGGKIKFNDLIRGEIEFDAELLGDFSIAKNEDTPLYNFAAAIDDYEMKISHVIRGEDHISNTPKQLLIFKALGLKEPQYAHLPLILGPDKAKLSKRHGATALFGYKEAGYLPDAMFNFLAFLGWNPQHETRNMKHETGDEEVMTRDEIINKFSPDAVQKSGAVFNVEKLNWINGVYIRKMPLDELMRRCEEFLPKNSSLDLKKIVALEQSRMKKLSEIGEMTKFFFENKLEYDYSLLKWKDMTDEELKDILEKLEKILGDIKEGDYTKEKLERSIIPEVENWGRGQPLTRGAERSDGGTVPAKRAEYKLDRGRMLWPLRVALTGRKASPGPFEIMEILGKEKSLARLREAIHLVC